LAGVSTAIVPPLPPPSEFCTDEKTVISNGCLEIFYKIITLLTVTVLFLFTFFNLILDAPRTLPKMWKYYDFSFFNYLAILWDIAMLGGFDAESRLKILIMYRHRQLTSLIMRVKGAPIERVTEYTAPWCVILLPMTVRARSPAVCSML
jgi:hypothetical protein